MRSLRLKFAAAAAAIAVALIPGMSAAQPAGGHPPFEGEGEIRGSNPASLIGLGVTETDFALTCVSPPVSQGVDGYVFDLGQVYPEGYSVVATGQNPTPFHDVDVYFYDSDCGFISESQAIGDESTTTPVGARYIVVNAFSGIATLVRLTVTPPAPDTTEDPTPEPSPTARARGIYPEAANDPLFADQWGMENINAPGAWQETWATGFEINIAIVDSGLDLDHPDFACAPWKVNVLPGSDIGDGDSDPNDEVEGHGTHVAGIAGACTNNAEGVVGVAPDATIMPVKVFGQNDSDLDQVMADGINFAIENGAHVINLSIGPGPGDSWIVEGFPETEDALKAAYDAGVVIAAASGNNTLPLCEYPSLSRWVICVSATDSNNLNAFYSDLPNNVDRQREDPQLEPGVMAPGGQGTFCEESIVSTFPVGLESICNTPGYEGLDGTSMASPHVAGLAALLYDRLGGDISPENRQTIFEAIIDTTQDLYTPGYDPISGYGLVDALAAVQSLPEPITVVHNPI